MGIIRHRQVIAECDNSFKSHQLMIDLMCINVVVVVFLVDPLQIHIKCTKYRQEQ